MQPQRLLSCLRHVGRTPEVLRCASQFEDWDVITSAYLGLRRMPLPCTVRTRSGNRFRLTELYDIETLWQVYCRQVYNVAPADRVVVDAGANIGLFTCFAAARAPHAVIHAVEPCPETFARLQETVRTNALESRVGSHQVALSSAPGTAAMSTAAKASQMFHLARTKDHNASGPVIQTVTLRALLDATACGTVDLLKMDIEGSEYDVLLSTPPDVLRRIRRIDVEYHQPETGAADKKALAAHVCRAGFRLREDPRRAGEYGLFHFIRHEDAGLRAG